METPTRRPLTAPLLQQEKTPQQHQCAVRSPRPWWRLLLLRRVLCAPSALRPSCLPLSRVRHCMCSCMRRVHVCFVVPSSARAIARSAERQGQETHASEKENGPHCSADGEETRAAKTPTTDWRHQLRKQQRSQRKKHGRTPIDPVAPRRLVQSEGNEKDSPLAALRACALRLCPSRCPPPPIAHADGAAARRTHARVHQPCVHVRKEAASPNTGGIRSKEPSSTT